MILSRACVCWRVEMDSSEAGCRPVVMPPLLDGWWPGDEDDATGTTDEGTTPCRGPEGAVVGVYG